MSNDDNSLDEELKMLQEESKEQKLLNEIINTKNLNEAFSSLVEQTMSGEVNIMEMLKLVLPQHSSKEDGQEQNTVDTLD